METKQPTELFDELQGILKEQITLARQGRTEQVEVLAQRAAGIIEIISRDRLFDEPQFLSARENIVRSYRDLMLTLTDQRDQVAGQLNRIRKGRKTIGVYRHSIQVTGKLAAPNC